MTFLTGNPTEMARKSICAVIFVSTSASIAGGFAASLKAGSGDMTGPLWAEVIILAAMLVFLIASGVVFYKSNIGCVLALVGGSLALVWFVLTESLFPHGLNSLVALNGADYFIPGQADVTILAEFRILSLGFVVMAIMCSILRLLPPMFLLRGRPLCERTWPALLVSMMIMIPWFIHSVRMSREPIKNRGSAPELWMIHADKEGLSFNVTEVRLFMDGQVYITRSHRSQLQYRFQTWPSLAAVSPTLLEEAHAIARLQGFSKVSRTTKLNRWNADDWYLLLGDSRALMFTTESGTSPPKQVTDLFQEILKASKTQERPYTVRDICLGFCYPPF
jgi:hypothetical protein